MLRPLSNLCSGMLLCAASAVSAQTSVELRLPVDIRRTTFLVNDAEIALKLYRDALGLKIIYDQIIESPQPSDEPLKSRLILLQAIAKSPETQGCCTNSITSPAAPFNSITPVAAG